jgi:hypothetical protein
VDLPARTSPRPSRAPAARVEPRAAGLPTAGLPTVGLPPAGLPTAGLPTAGLPPAGLPTAGLPTAGLPPVGPRTAGLVAVGLLAVGLLAGCGAPPQPLPSGPPRFTGSGGPVPSGPATSGSAYPGGIVPTGLPTPPVGGPPTVPGLPTGGYTPPTVPTTTTTTTTVRPTSTVKPAPRCTKGPTAEQVLAELAGAPGVPADVELTVSDGPYCAGTWQFATVEREPDATGKTFDPLLVVTRGKPSALTLVEAGADVCSDVVQKDAPPGIRVRACGT